MYRAIAALLTGVALNGAAAPVPSASAQTESAFDFSPREARPGSFVEIMATCEPAPPGATGVQLLVVLDESDGSFKHQRTYAPEVDGTVRAAFDIPAEAPIGNYFVYGSCNANGASFFRHTSAFEVVDRSTTRLTTEVTGETRDPSDDTTGMLRALVVLVALGSALLVGFGEWSRRHPAGNHNHRRHA